jgi:hypothetical protein
MRLYSRASPSRQAEIPAMPEQRYRLAVDIGGTFTDVAC